MALKRQVRRTQRCGRPVGPGAGRGRSPCAAVDLLSALDAAPSFAGRPVWWTEFVLSAVLARASLSESLLPPAFARRVGRGRETGFHGGMICHGSSLLAGRVVERIIRGQASRGRQGANEAPGGGCVSAVVIFFPGLFHVSSCGPES